MTCAFFLITFHFYIINNILALSGLISLKVSTAPLWSTVTLFWISAALTISNCQVCVVRFKSVQLSKKIVAPV